MVGGDGEGHELLQGHAVLGIDPEQLLGDGGQPQPLLDHGRRDEEAGGDLLLAGALVAQRLEGAELVERMQGGALDVLGERILLGRDLDRGVAHDAGHRRRLGKALLLHQQLERPVAAAAGGDLEHAGLGAVGVEDRPDVEALQQPAPAMSSASSSIETPAFTRRTLDWLSTSLLKGMSREALRVIF